MTIRVTPGAFSIPVAGSLSDEPLHFEPLPDGAFHALGAVPLGRTDSALVQVVLWDSRGMVETVGAWLPVVRRNLRRERLRTSPEFARQPDSVLAARIAAERERVQEVLRGTHRTPRLWHERFVRPRGSRVTSPFGARRVVNDAEGGRHLGADFQGGLGAPVVAPNRGVVALTGSFYYSGRLVYVDHGAGLVTGYLHLSRILVAEGDTVEAGQVIGRVGATGRVTGPHLHWLAHYGRVGVDPLDLPRLEPLSRP